MRLSTFSIIAYFTYFIVFILVFNVMQWNLY